jgi:hypothetical protein
MTLRGETKTLQVAEGTSLLDAAEEVRPWHVLCVVACALPSESVCASTAV